MNFPSVFIEHYSLISALGLGKQQTVTALQKNELDFLTASKKFRADEEHLMLGLVNSELASLDGLPAWQQSRCNQLLWVVWQDIKSYFFESTKSVDPLRIGVIIGTSTSGIAEGEHIHTHFDDVIYERQKMICPAQSLADWSGVKGPVLSISTACTSGAKALASARRWLQSGYCDAVLVGGVDSLCKLTVSGFSALESVSEELCTPFGKDRKGINIGEGAGLFLLSKKTSQLCLSGVGESSDAHHISAPDPSASGAIQAINSALDDARLQADQIDYINAHGTATEKNDAMESLAISQVFGDKTLVSSTKPLTGHTLGAAGAIEAALSCLLLEYSELSLPMNYYGRAIDDTLPLINLVTTDSSQVERKHIISHSFAFGGNNIALILSQNTGV